MTDLDLYNIAKEAIDKAYAPYSSFKVGAALLTKDGRVFSGVNVENSSYGATICAERTAVVKAVSEGYRSFEAIAVATCDGTSAPCGICRQFIYEFGSDIRIIFRDASDQIKKCRISELLPDGFRLRPEDRDGTADCVNGEK